MSRKSFLPDWKGIWSFLVDGNSDWKPKAIALVAIAYLLWPLDLLPDIVPVIGWLDDIGFVSLASWYLVRASTAHAKRIGKKD